MNPTNLEFLHKSFSTLKNRNKKSIRNKVGDWKPSITPNKIPTLTNNKLVNLFSWHISTRRNSKQTGQSLINHKFKTNKENHLTADNHIIIIRYPWGIECGTTLITNQIYASPVWQNANLLACRLNDIVIYFVFRFYSILLTKFRTNQPLRTDTMW